MVFVPVFKQIGILGCRVVDAKKENGCLNFVISPFFAAGHEEEHGKKMSVL
jgi:hypothetical protein